MVKISVGFKLTINEIHQLFNNNFFASAQVVVDHSYNRDLLPLPIVIRSNIQERQLASKVFLLSFILGKA
jgi:hypothetical protein